MRGWAIGLPAALVLGLLVLAARQDEPEGFWAPEGYVAQADTLIRRGLVELVCGAQDSVVVRVEKGSPEAEFFASSYLRADVRDFNARPAAGRAPFTVEGCQIVGVDPWYHRIDLPFNRLPRWRGDVLFRRQVGSALFRGGRDQELEVRHPAGHGEMAREAAFVALGRAGVRVSTPLLHLERQRSGEVVGSAFFVGDDPVLMDRSDRQSGDHIRVNGLRAPPGRLARLESGDWVQVVLREGAPASAAPVRTPPGGGRSGPYTYFVELGERARTASFVRVENERIERLFPAERMRPFVEPLSRAMDLALQSIPGAEDPGAAVPRAAVRLSIDRDLHDGVEAGLLEWCAANAHPTRPRTASLLVMDALSGGVRAMPSCPGTLELAPYEPMSARTRERFLRNQNLIPHPVGSAAKPFWAAAVATAYPGFLDLQVPPHPAGPADSLLGCPLRAPYGDLHGSENWVGMEEFLQRSCNRYVVEYATAALALGSRAADPACRGEPAGGTMADCFPDDTTRQGTPVRFCDRVVRLMLTDDLQAVGSRCDNLQLVHAAFRPAPAFDRLTNTSSYSEPAPGLDRAERPGLTSRYRAGRYRVDTWRRVLERLGEAGDTAHLVNTSLRFSAVSPQSTNLGLNTVEQLRTDWVNLLLGGENSQWSNFALAEALARLMTGRAVAGEFVDGFGDPAAATMADVGGFPALSADHLHPGVRRRVLHGMERVARSGGTAAALEPYTREIERRLGQVVPGRPYDAFVFAKTGTPAVEKFVSSSQQRLVQRLFVSGRIRWDAGSGRFHLAQGTADSIRDRLGTGSLRWLAEDVLGPIERDPAAFTQVAGRAPPNHPLYLSPEGHLRSRELLDRRLARQGGVLLLGILAVPRERGRSAVANRDEWVSACPLEPGLRSAILDVPPADAIDPAESVAMTVAIYLDDLAPGEGAGLAVRLAERVLEEIGSYVVAEVERKADRTGG